MLAALGNKTSTISVATLVGIHNAAAFTTTLDSTTVAPVAGLNLRSLDFTDASNWYGRVFTFTAQQNTPDSTGNARNVERRASSVAAQVAAWGSGGKPKRQADLSFNGTAWVNCPLDFESTSMGIDAAGTSRYNYCNNRETGINNRANLD